MFARLLVFSLLISSYSFAQIDGQRSSTKFDKFINLSKIQWAAYTNDTIRFDTYNLSDELYKRFQKGEIKISLPLSRDSLMAGKPIIYVNKKELGKKSFAPGLSPVKENQKPTNRVDSNSSEVINVEEILYVANGKLHSYIPWVSPRISIYTSRDQFIGTSEYFSSCINFKYNFKPAAHDDLIFIKSTKRKFLINSFPQTEMLKEVYGRNMIEAIWNEIMNDKNEFIDIKSGQKTSVKGLREYTFPSSITIPVYDSLGNLMGTKNYNAPLSPFLFQQIEITQNWFYNYSKNIVINNIPDITLFLRSKNFQDYEEMKPTLKIIFK
jgi:hypothetical protein